MSRLKYPSTYDTLLVSCLFKWLFLFLYYLPHLFLIYAHYLIHITQLLSSQSTLIPLPTHFFLLQLHPLPLPSVLCPPLFVLTLFSPDHSPSHLWAPYPLHMRPICTFPHYLTLHIYLLVHYLCPFFSISVLSPHLTSTRLLPPYTCALVFPISSRFAYFVFFTLLPLVNQQLFLNY